MLINLLTEIILIGIAFQIWISRKISRPGSELVIYCSALILVTTKLWQYIVANSSLLFILNIIHYVSIAVLVAAWLYFCVKNILQKDKIEFFNFALLCILPILFSIAILTNQYHNIMGKLIIWSGNIDQNINWGSYLYIGYVYLASGAGFSLILKKSYQNKLHFLKYTIILTIIILVPLIFLLMHYLNINIIIIGQLITLSFYELNLAIIYFVFQYANRTFFLPQNNIIDAVHDVLVVVNKQRHILYLNKAALTLIKNPCFHVVGQDLFKYFPTLIHVLKSDNIQDFKRQIVGLGNRLYDLDISPVHSWRNKIVAYILNLHDISQIKDKNIKKNLKQIKAELEYSIKQSDADLREVNKALIMEILEHKKAQEIIGDSLEEKNILIGEIHHRVKNNLQIIISLLKLQSRYSKDESTKDIFRTIINRIRSIGIIHEKLYKSEDLSRTNAKDYINDLARYLLNSFESSGKSVNISVNSDEIYLDLDRSILCGLIINELVSNSLKHAFPNKSKNKENQVKINFFIQGEDLILSVSDNGVGLPDDLDISRSDSLGMKIVNTLVNQLNGSIDLKKYHGTKVNIKFKKEKTFSKAFTEQEEILQRIQKALIDLPKKIREVTVLYYLEGKTVSEVSGILKISGENAQTRLQIARKRLREILTKGISKI